MTPKNNLIAFQGAHGAYSDLACRTVFPEMETLPCQSFDDAFEAVVSGTTELAMIPIENSIAGRVADVHRLMPKNDLNIIAEDFSPISHCLLGPKGATLDGIQNVHSHVHALPQCSKFLKEKGLNPIVASDTASAANFVAETGKQSEAAIASTLAAEIYDLEIIAKDIQDENINTTRFIVLSRDKKLPEIDEKSITSILFTVRHVPAALYKALGSFAIHGFNMMKIESYVDIQFQNAQFLLEVEGHQLSDGFKLAFEELNFYAHEARILGTYKSHPYRDFLNQENLAAENHNK